MLLCADLLMQKNEEIHKIDETMTRLMLMTQVLSGLLLAVPLWLTCKWDRPLFRLVCRVLLRYVAGLAALGAALWLLLLADSWALCALWLVLVVAVCALLSLARARLDRHRLWLQLAGSMLIVSGLTGLAALGVTGALSSKQAFLGTMAVLLAHVYVATAAGLHAFYGSKQATVAHQEYLLGNGATRLEALKPSFVRAVRAALLPGLKQMSVVSVLTVPTVLAGLLLGGAPVLAAVCMSWLLVSAGLSAGVMTLLLTLWMAEGRQK